MLHFLIFQYKVNKMYLVLLIPARTSRHTRTLPLLTDLRPVLALLVLWIIAACLAAWIHQLGILNISNWCVWRAQAWRSYNNSWNLHLNLLLARPLCVCVCVTLSMSYWHFGHLSHLEQHSNKVHCEVHLCLYVCMSLFPISTIWAFKFYS